MAEEKTVERKLQLDIKLIIFGIALLILASVGTSFTTYLFFSSANPPESEEVVEEEPAIPEFGPTHDIGVFTVNLTGDSGRRFARVGISLELKDATLIPLVEERMPQIRDAVISILSMKQMQELADLDNRRRLRGEIAGRLGNILGIGNVNNIFFTEFVFQ